MPMYLYQCRTCGRKTEKIRTVAERNRRLSCPCGRTMKLTIAQIASPIIYSPSSGLGDGGSEDMQFTGPRDKARKLKAKGLAEYDPGVPKMVANNKREHDAASEDRPQDVEEEAHVISQRSRLAAIS